MGSTLTRPSFEDIAIALSDVRFREQSGHQANFRECPLLTQSGHHLPRKLRGGDLQKFARPLIEASALDIRFCLPPSLRSIFLPLSVSRVERLDAPRWQSVV